MGHTGSDAAPAPSSSYRRSSPAGSAGSVAASTGRRRCPCRFPPRQGESASNPRATRNPAPFSTPSARSSSSTTSSRMRTTSSATTRTASRRTSFTSRARRRLATQQRRPYCSPACAHAVAQRKYRGRQRELKASSGRAGRRAERLALPIHPAHRERIARMPVRLKNDDAYQVRHGAAAKLV